MRIMLEAGTVKHNKGSSRASPKRTQINRYRKCAHLRNEDTGSSDIQDLPAFMNFMNFLYSYHNKQQCLLDCVNYDSNIVSCLSFPLAVHSLESRQLCLPLVPRTNQDCKGRPSLALRSQNFLQ